jgi:hypothetical protein
MKLCAVSVDLDEIHHYYGIHGLPVSSASAAALNAVYGRALGRFTDFARESELPLTFFAVGADLTARDNARALGALSAEGHEIGNHTFDHLYGLSRRPREEIADQIERANLAILAATGQRPVGFRAPGYVMSEQVYAALADCGMAYSSSVFPCPYYYAAKFAKIAGLRLLGRRSQSVIDSPRVLGAPRLPYRVGVPYWQPGAGMLELPIQVTPALRLPFFGTSLTLLGPRLGRRLVRSLAGLSLVNLELHGVDLLDASDELQELAQHQFDLRVSVARKWSTLSAVVAELRALGYRFVRLDQAARELSDPLSGASAPAPTAGRHRSPE